MKRHYFPFFEKFSHKFCPWLSSISLPSSSLLEISICGLNKYLCKMRKKLEQKKLLSLGAKTFCLLDILLTCHFVNILSTWQLGKCQVSTMASWKWQVDKMAILQNYKLTKSYNKMTIWQNSKVYKMVSWQNFKLSWGHWSWGFHYLGTPNEDMV